jgi:A/G-specific adenine glycosylase
MPLVAQTVDHENPREWYYALMDYGVMLKKSQPNPSRKSRHYTKQSRFEGSDRQIRGAIIRALTQHKSLTPQELIDVTGKEPERIMVQLDALRKEGFIEADSANVLCLRRV